MIYKLRCQGLQLMGSILLPHFDSQTWIVTMDVVHPRLHLKQRQNMSSPDRDLPNPIQVS